MKTFVLGLATASLLVITGAVNPNGDPSDLNNYPACAQQCISSTFGPPANCGNFANTTCLCTTAAAARILASCEIASCTPTEQEQTNTLAKKHCASAGGIAPVETTVQSSILASSQVQIPTTASFPASLSAVDQASSILATATPAPNLGNPATNVYPDCTNKCVNETAAILTEPNNLSQVCGLQYRLQTAVCEAALCSDSDRQNTQLLAQQICRPFYANNATLGSSVIAAIASATPVAKAAVAGKTITDQSTWPQCATCLCGNAAAIAPLDACEDDTCSVDERISQTPSPIADLDVTAS
ncbi:MAG: hypothetical protein Q9168_007951 [Polycauliona sp. 1 TL-2023]